MTAVRTALLVANSTDSDAGYVGERLSQRGYALRTVLRETGEVPVDVATAGDVDVVVCLGSEWSVHTPVDASALRAECALVRSASAAQIPVLGICYGAQVVAAAFGGAVTRAATPEIGWIEVTSLDADLVPTGPWLAFHLDVVHLPPQARLVADNDCGAQAFVLPGVLAVQFHPEVRPAVLDDWAERFPGLLSEVGVDRRELLAQGWARESESRRAAHALVDGFLDQVAPQLRSSESSSP
ncbi:MAG: gamma-glutamyl-gamma-aminobutyrate hydrolase family protein [Nocardioidaceae bacterium]|nr:gamma-glutamyl-gamma-aminobutyrate hydrolase family protein [Nocardioidaceae bacterium]